MKKNIPLNQISASEAGAAIKDGKLTSEALVLACLERVQEREVAVQAWSYIDADIALTQARARDKETPRSRLHGIPFGIKDVIDTFDMPTEYGSPIYKGHRPSCDAASVAQVRELGGVILGKTVSTEFATRHPNKTRNPHNLSRTPGGSSSGSASAVSDYMVPVAFGTQTSSSIIRPAAYCGVIGYKPSFGLINRAGIKFLSESLDTIGTISRTVADAALIVEELSGMTPTSFDAVATLKPRIGFCRTPWWGQADDTTQSTLEQAAITLAAAGAKVTDVTLDTQFAQLNDIQVSLSSYEFYRALTHERTRHSELISTSLTNRIAAGGKVDRKQYESALASAIDCRARIAEIFENHDLLLAPSTPSEAPCIEVTGEPTFGLMWTLLRLPCLTLPYGKGPLGLPLGIQLIGAYGRDIVLLLNAEWVRRALDR